MNPIQSMVYTPERHMSSERVRLSSLVEVSIDEETPWLVWRLCGQTASRQQTEREYRDSANTSWRHGESNSSIGRAPRSPRLNPKYSCVLINHTVGMFGGGSELSSVTTSRAQSLALVRRKTWDPWGREPRSFRFASLPGSNPSGRQVRPSLSLRHSHGPHGGASRILRLVSHHLTGPSGPETGV